MSRTLALLCSLLIATAALAQPAPRPLTAAQRTAALTAIKAAFRERYVIADKRAMIVARIDEQTRAGRYDVSDPQVFCDRLSDDLRAVAHDGHLGLRCDPAGYAAALAQPAGDAGGDAMWARRAARENHGIAELRRLPGNLRYLKLTGFHWTTDVTGAVYDDAMRFLRGGDAVIIDLRGNGGGEHAAVLYLISHFLPPNTFELEFHHVREPVSQMRTLEHVPAGRLRGVPLYVLIDGGTASAAEAFAYDVQQFRLGELIGSKTAGAAHNNAFVPIAPGFLLSISEGRPVHAIGRGNWEGTGIAPTTAVAPGTALEVAQQRALAKLAAAPTASPEARAEYAWARTAIDAKLAPPVVAAGTLARHAGRYAEYEIAWRDGALWFARLPGAPRRMIALTADGLFALEGAEHLRARFTPRGLELTSEQRPTPRIVPRGAPPAPAAR